MFKIISVGISFPLPWMKISSAVERSAYLGCIRHICKLSEVKTRKFYLLLKYLNSKSFLNTFLNK